MSRIKVVITGGAAGQPDRASARRRHVSEGFEEQLGAGSVANMPLPLADLRVKTARPQLALVFGSVLADQCDYSALRHACDEIGCPLVFWITNDPYEFDAHTKIVGVADYLFTN